MQVSVYVRVDDKKLSSLKIRDRWIFRETDFKKKIFICNFQQFFYKMKFFRQIDMNSELTYANNGENRILFFNVVLLKVKICII